MTQIDPVILLVLRLTLALIFATGLAHKLKDLRAFGAAVAEYRLLPSAFVIPGTAALLLLEMLVVLALLLPGLGVFGAWAAAASLMLYAGAIAVNLARGRRAIDCGCSGPASGQQLSEWLVLRNAMLAVLAVLAAQAATPRVLSGWDASTIAFGVVALMLLYSTANHLIANQPKLKALFPSYD
jgi:hypothetical protein